LPKEDKAEEETMKQRAENNQEIPKTKRDSRGYYRANRRKAKRRRRRTTTTTMTMKKQTKKKKKNKKGGKGSNLSTRYRT
jgi:hypothetical protein